MKTMLLIDFVVLMVVAFVDWLVPRAGHKTRELFEDWWLRFVNMDYTCIGSFVAKLVTCRMDLSLGGRSPNLRFLCVSFVLSQIIFVLVLIWVSLAWGAIPASNFSEYLSALKTILMHLRHCILPLLAINTIFDMVSLGVTRHILRKAAKSTDIAKYASLIGLDLTIATAIVLLSAIFFANFYFAPDFPTGVMLFFVYLGFVPATLFLIASPLMIYMALTGKLSTRTTLSPCTPQNGCENPSRNSIQVFPKRVENVVIGLGVFLLLLPPIALFWLAIKNSFYVPYLNLDWSNVSLILIVSVSFTAIIPTMLNFLLLIGIFFLRLLSKPAHVGLSHFLLRLAETPRGVLYLIVIVLAVFKDLLMILLVRA